MNELPGVDRAIPIPWAFCPAFAKKMMVTYSHIVTTRGVGQKNDLVPVSLTAIYYSMSRTLTLWCAPHGPRLTSTGGCTPVIWVRD